MFTHEQALALGIQYEALRIKIENLKKMNTSIINRDKMLQIFEEAYKNFWDRVFAND